MEAAISLSEDTRSTAGVLLLTIVAVEYGGTFMLRVVRGRVGATEFQRSFFRAGHAHAGVLVVLALLAQILADAAEMHGPPARLTRSGVPVAAILMPAGFFFSSAGRGPRSRTDSSCSCTSGRQRSQSVWSHSGSDSSWCSAHRPLRGVDRSHARRHVFNRERRGAGVSARRASPKLATARTVRAKSVMDILRTSSSSGPTADG
jgi:hypothetical protein